MNAADVIELIKKLPPAEKAEVMAFLNKDAGVAESPARYASTTESDQRKVRTIPRADAERIADEIFDRHAELFRKLAQ